MSYASNPAFPKKDNAVITLRFASGAVGTVIYTAMGSKKYPKEQLRVFANGAVYEMDNYVSMGKYGSVKKKEIKLKQDKGIGAEYRYIADIMKKGQENHELRDAFLALRLLMQRNHNANGWQYEEEKEDSNRE